MLHGPLNQTESEKHSYFKLSFRTVIEHICKLYSAYLQVHYRCCRDDLIAAISIAICQKAT